MKLQQQRQWECLKHNRFYVKNNNSACASHFFVCISLQSLNNSDVK